MAFTQYLNEKGVKVWARKSHIGREKAFDICTSCKRVDCPIKAFRNAVGTGHNTLFIVWSCGEFLYKLPTQKNRIEMDTVFAQAD